MKFFFVIDLFIDLRFLSSNVGSNRNFERFVFFALACFYPSFLPSAALSRFRQLP
jgi:hypothetical protein